MASTEKKKNREGNLLVHLQQLLAAFRDIFPSETKNILVVVALCTRRGKEGSKKRLRVVVKAVVAKKIAIGMRKAHQGNVSRNRKHHHHYYDHQLQICLFCL